jgi:hypothetical protein
MTSTSQREEPQRCPRSPLQGTDQRLFQFLQFALFEKCLSK